MICQTNFLVKILNRDINKLIMSQDNTEFYQLLNSLATEQTFDLTLSNNQTAKCKQLTTAQLKELIKTIVDSPLTQAAFNTTATKIFSQSLLDVSMSSLDIVDRLLFLLETRSNSLSPMAVLNNNNEEIHVNFESLRENLIKTIRDNPETFQEQVIKSDKITLYFSIPKLKTETQMNEELYKNLEINVDTAEELRKVLGEAFINEIAKTLNKIEIEDKSLNLNEVTFKSRLKTIESLPASLTQKVIEFVEKYKNLIDNSLTVDGYTIPIDGSLFSAR